MHSILNRVKNVILYIKITSICENKQYIKNKDDYPSKKQQMRNNCDELYRSNLEFGYIDIVIKRLNYNTENIKYLKILKAQEELENQEETDDVCKNLKYN